MTATKFQNAAVALMGALIVAALFVGTAVGPVLHIA
jgi:hypothetical protein